MFPVMTQISAFVFSLKIQDLNPALIFPMSWLGDLGLRLKRAASQVPSSSELLKLPRLGQVETGSDSKQ